MKEAGRGAPAPRPNYMPNKFVKVGKRPIQTLYGRKAPGEVFECAMRDADYLLARRLVEEVERPKRRPGRPRKHPRPDDESRHRLI